MHFKVADSNFQERVSRCTTTFIVFRTIRFFCYFGHKNRGKFFLLLHKNRGKGCYWFLACFSRKEIAQKSRQLMQGKRDSLLVEISWILTVNECLIFPEANNKNSLSLTGFPLVGFSRAVGRKY